VFAELVTPEIAVWSALVDPVRIHPLEEIITAKRFKECTNVGTLVRRYNGAVRKAGSRVWGWHGVVLTVQVAILGVAAVAIVGPETVQGPGVLGEFLTL
jgi:hypothetical protein